MEPRTGIRMAEEMLMDWEAAYQQGDMPWNKGTCAPELDFALKEAPLAGRVLVPGCGLGHDARAIAAAGLGEVLGLDVAPSAVIAASQIPGPVNLRFELGDLFALPQGLTARFDWVWEHTCFCAIPMEMRDSYVEAVWKALHSGGQLLGVFYLDPKMDERESGPPFGVTRRELDQYFGARFEVVREWAPRAAFPGREGREWVRLMRRRE